MSKDLLTILFFSLAVSSSPITTHFAHSTKQPDNHNRHNQDDNIEAGGVEVRELVENSDFSVNHYNNDGIIRVDDIFGTNSRFFTVCSSEACCKRTLLSKDHENKVMLFFPLSHIDGDSYMTYYMGLIFEMFEKLDVHILIWSVSHSLQGGPYDEITFMSMLRACVHTGDYSLYSYEFCVHFAQVLNGIALFCANTLYHKNLAVIVLNDASIVPGYVDIIENYPERSKNSSSLLALVHLNHEQPWVDNQRYSTQRILQGYRGCRLVFRTHYYSDFVTDNVHYLPLGAGILKTEHIALGLQAHERRYPPKEYFEAASLTLASERSWLCSFAGSMKYVNRGNSFESSRVEMIETLGDVPGCVFHPTDDVARAAPLSQREYMQLTLSSVFSLCPRGVGPETNRPHQALELGAIPVMVREADDKKDFLAKWSGYPGPIFASWQDAKIFLYDVINGDISLRGIEALQEELRVWYRLFQESTKERVRDLVMEAMEAQSK